MMSTEVIDRPATGQTQALAERPQERQSTPLTVVQYAMQSGATPAEVRALLELQVASDNHQLALLKERRTMDKEDRAVAALLAYRTDFARFKALNIVAPKSKTVTQRSKSGGAGPSFKQSEMDVIANLLQPALASCGFSYRFDPKFQRSAEGGIAWCVVTVYLEHSGGHFETVTLEGPPDDSGAKNPLQEMQSSSTFLQRHCLLAITGTAQSGADNDGNGTRGSSTAAETDITDFLLGLGATANDDAAAAYWNVNKGLLQGEALAKFKAAVVAHRMSMKGAAK